MANELSDHEISRLKSLCCHPRGLIKILFFTSSFPKIEWMQRILMNWPKITIAATLFQKTHQIPKHICMIIDIVLVDIDLDEMYNFSIEKMLVDCAYPGIIGSMAQGKNLDNKYKHYFGRMDEVATSMNAAAEFIAWINTLINETEMNYFPLVAVQR